MAGRFVSRITSFPPTPTHTDTSLPVPLPGAVSRPVQYPPGGIGGDGPAVFKNRRCPLSNCANPALQARQRLVPAPWAPFAARYSTGLLAVWSSRPAGDSGIRPSAMAVSFAFRIRFPVVFVEAEGVRRSAQRAAEVTGTAQALPCSRSSAVIPLFFSPKM